jgi:(p)ppGpp synthase/HD superfamily hydrolase
MEKMTSYTDAVATKGCKATVAVAQGRNDLRSSPFVVIENELDLESARSIAERTGIAAEVAGPALILGHAYLLAASVHAFESDKCGVPYLHHVIRVADAMDNDTERAVAIMHDVLENCGSAKRANTLYAYIVKMYGVAVAGAVAALTRLPHEDYAEYIARVAENPLAVKVKIQDALDNSRTERLIKLPEKEYIRLLTKYKAALAFLGYDGGVSGR